MKMEISSVVPEFNDAPIVIVGHDLAQDDLDRYVRFIRYGHNDTWLHLRWPSPASMDERCDQPIIEHGSPDQPITIPKVHVSQRLGGPRRSRSYQQEEKPHEIRKDPALAFLLVIQGRSGGSRGKLVLRTDLHIAGAEMFYEAINGYSVVFSGVILKTNLGRRTDITFSFRKAHSLAERVDMDADGSQKLIGVLC